jgi:hypothetical protein
LTGTNLTGANDFKLTQLNGGIPYGGLSGNILTNAIPAAGRQFIFSVAHHV